MKRAIVRKDSYYDSVFLMLISTDVKKVPGISEAVVAMGTEMNRDLIAGMGLSDPAVAGATANDLIITVDAQSEEAVAAAQAKVDELLQKKRAAGAGASYRPGSLDAAVRFAPDANLAVISLPGEFAAREARRALKAGLHVMLFSDNVPIEEEVRLKKLALESGLLMMGPDCGSAIINGRPICFANVVPRGPIGIVSASGTGLQEVSSAIAKAGSGVSQALGTGGRDLKDERVGGMMTLACIEALGADPATEVIVVISKPPKASLTARVIDALERTGKPAVVHFVGAPASAGATTTPGVVGRTVRVAADLTEAARMATGLAGGSEYEPRVFDLPDRDIDAIVRAESARIGADQKYLRGLFVGGTLTDEAVAVLSPVVGSIHSFDTADPAFALADPHRSTGHTIVDLGEDVFTVGRPHPMIDPSTRIERIEREGQDPEVALLLLDCVLGYGSHPDPAGAMVPAIRAARAAADRRGGYLPVIASITGTDGDFQGLAAERGKLEDEGVVVMPTNYQAAMLAARIMERRSGT